jgi:hypothetical protein
MNFLSEESVKGRKKFLVLQYFASLIFTLHNVDYRRLIYDQGFTRKAEISRSTLAPSP